MGWSVIERNSNLESVRVRFPRIVVVVVGCLCSKESLKNFFIIIFFFHLDRLWLDLAVCPIPSLRPSALHVILECMMRLFYVV